MDIISIPGFDEPFSSISHLFASGLFLVLAVFTLYKGRGSAPRMLGLFVFSFFAIVLFAMSGVFHLLEKGTTASHVLQILDHTAIFTMIAGTFTPFHIILLRGKTRWLPLLIIWLLAITGLTFTAIYFSDMSEGLILSFFLIMGWMGAFTVMWIWRVSADISKLIMWGSALYTVGALVDFFGMPVLMAGVVNAHELFHIAIVAAALCHWRAIYKIAHYPLTERLTVIVKELPNELQGYLFGQCVARAQNQKELHVKLQQWFSENYPIGLIPRQLYFKFYKEAWVNLG